MIPKLIHVSWKDKSVINNSSYLIQNGLKKLIELNPDWEFTIYDDEDVDTYLKNVLGQDYKLYKDAKIIEKLDIWRLFKIYNEGGLYIDIDRYYNVPLNKIVTKNIKWILPTSGNYDFSHDFMMSAPDNPVYMNTIQLVLQRRYQGNRNVYFLGAQTYMHSITQYLLGEMINTNPGKEKFDEIRKAIEKMSFIKTYCEDLPYNSIVYKDETKRSKQDWEQAKRDFYDSYNVKHWTEEW